jgi:hypothetical protein
MFTCIMPYCFHCSICALRCSVLLFQQGNRKKKIETVRDQRHEVTQSCKKKRPSNAGKSFTSNKNMALFLANKMRINFELSLGS